MITDQTMIPDLVRRHPQTRAVLDRYGLNGCGGRLGPVETIAFFARTHGVDEMQLLWEIQEAIENPSVAGDEAPPSVADTIYRRFFIGGIFLILTAGATWGAWLLWTIGFASDFTGISIHHVNAHGHAQIFGWVGLFIMGFAYQAFPRMWQTRLVAPRLAVFTFALMVFGLVIRTIGMTLSESWSLALPSALVGAGVQILAVSIFATQIGLTFRRSKMRLEPYVGFIFGALGWFIAMSVMDAWHTFTTMSSATREQLLWYVATYQAPLRDLQIHGLALFMILGVSMRMLPALFDLKRTSDMRGWWALGILTVAVAAEAILFIAYRWTDNSRVAAMLMLPWIMLMIGVALVAWPWKLWKPFDNPDRSGKFIRGAYAWLAVSLVMLLLLPVYQVISGIDFSHAYYGAIRHAITVGFISLMIMGFAAKVVPTLNGIDTRTLTALWGPFILVNVGCFLRVSTQVLTDWHASFFAVVGVSGTLEVIGLSWWGGHLIQIMLRGKREARQQEDEQSPPTRIYREHKVAQVYQWFPATRAVFERYGFTLLKQAAMRRTVARSVSIAQAASFRGVCCDEFLDALNHAIGNNRHPHDRRTCDHSCGRRA